MREQLPLIKKLYLMSPNIDDAIESAYQAGRVDGVLQYLEEKITRESEYQKNLAIDRDVDQERNK